MVTPCKVLENKSMHLIKLASLMEVNLLFYHPQPWAIRVRHMLKYLTYVAAASPIFFTYTEMYLRTYLRAHYGVPSRYLLVPRHPGPGIHGAYARLTFLFPTLQ